jgi:hypothetical protein
MIGIKKATTYIFATCLAVLAAPVSAQETWTMPVDDSFFDESIRWVNGGPASYKYKWKAVVKGNKVGVCGAGVYLSSERRAITRKVMKDRVFYIDDTAMLKDMTFFTKSKSRNLNKAVATCKLSNTKPPSKVEKGVSIRSGNPKKVYF